MVTMETVVTRGNGIFDANVGDQTVLMSVENEQYYALTATSRAIWDLLKEPVRVRDLCAKLASAYEMLLDTVETDTLEFLNYLEAQKMIESRVG